MTGLVGVIAQETARFSMFGSSLSEMTLPEGWQVKWRFGHDIAQSTNALIDEMYLRDLDAIWLLGDDHAWSPDLLEKLLAHDVEIVVPLCLMRNPPYQPVIWDTELRRIYLDDHPDGGLIEVGAAGSAGMLIRRDALDEMAIKNPREPAFTVYRWFAARGPETNRVGEDIGFCMNARDAGLKIHCDLDSSMGHCTTAVVWPVREPDGWTYGFSMMGGYQITMPPRSGQLLANRHA